MRLPDRVAYAQAMQLPSLAFSHLKDPPLGDALVELNALQQPMVASGAFAITFSLVARGRRYAVRCFTQPGNQVSERYAAVARFVRDANLGFLVQAMYLPDAIAVEGKRWPVVVMPWVAGRCLNDWIDANLTDTDALDQVRRSIARAVAELRQRNAAHGDLQHGNILVRDNKSITLIDYDGMYLPEIDRYGAAEQGHHNYQHPMRANQFDSSLDLVSAYVIDLSIAATAHEPRLWEKFNHGDNLLFTARDLADPDSSEIFARLEKLAPLATRARRLRLACLSPPDAAGDILSGQVTPTIGRPAGPGRRRQLGRDRS